MIEKFNFYDIYGYFVPGLALLAILWIPFGLAQHIWPAKDWGSAIIALAFAYVLGHLTQAVATNAIPSREAKSGAGKDRYPSETVLDPGSRELPAEVQAKIASEVNAQFGLDIHIQNSGGEFDSVRNNAFLLARQVLIREKAASYAEQFQGMYALERGLIAVLAVGVAYFAGWAFSIVRWNYSLTEATVSVSVALLILVNSGFALLREKTRPTQTDAERKQLRDENRIRKQKLERIYTATLLVLFALVGYLIGSRYELDANRCGAFSILAIAALLALLRCYGQYRFFAVRFATTVWRDFLAYSAKDSSSQRPVVPFE